MSKTTGVGGWGGQMNRDIVRRLVKRKQGRDGRLKENCVYIHIRDRQHRKTKQFLIGRESDRKKGGGVVLLSL